MFNPTNYKTTELAQLLAQSFSKDPWIESLFPDNPKGTQHFFEFILQYYKASGGTILIETRDDHLAGVACIETPAPQYSLSNLFKITSALVTFLVKCGPKKLLMSNKYMQLTLKNRPNESHHYLVCIGVAPEFMGLGIGKKILNTVHELVNQDAKSVGIGLDTENINNVSLYEHFDYKLTGIETLNALKIYTMFRKKNT